MQHAINLLKAQLASEEECAEINASYGKERAAERHLDIAADLRRAIDHLDDAKPTAVEVEALAACAVIASRLALMFIQEPTFFAPAPSALAVLDALGALRCANTPTATLGAIQQASKAFGSPGRYRPELREQLDALGKAYTTLRRATDPELSKP
jgi:hypothetical protein